MNGLAKPVPPVGAVFGRWTITATGLRHGKCNGPAASVRCECGRESVVQLADLRHGRSRGCNRHGVPPRHLRKARERKVAPPKPPKIWPSRPAEERFALKVQKTDGCWLWTGATLQDGYGMFRVSPSRNARAHRYALEVKIGRTLSADEQACHACDNPRCVRPEHLFLGTTQENTADMVAKGRQARGEACYHAKLTADLVRSIRRALREGAKRDAVAERFGISPSGLAAIEKRRTWRHVAD